MRTTTWTALLAFGVALVTGPATAARPPGTVYFVDKAGGYYGVWRMNSDGSQRRHLTQNPNRSGGSGDGVPLVAPGVNKVFFLRSVGGNDANARFYSMNRDGSGIRQVGKRATTNGVTISYDGRRAVAFDRVSDISGAHARKIGGVQGQVGGASFSRDGRQLVYLEFSESAAAKLVASAINGSARRVIISQAGPEQTDGYRLDADPRFSPNGREIAFECHRPRDKTSSVCAIDTDGRGFRVIAQGVGPLDVGGNLYAPHGPSAVWDPTGRHLAFNCGLHLRSICTINRDGTTKRTIGRGSNPSWG